MNDGVAEDQGDRSAELAERLSEASEAVAPLLDSDDGHARDDEEAVREALDALAADVRDAGFADILRAAGVEDLPDDPTPADLPELMADADDGDLAVVRRLLGARDLADEWDELGSAERTERLDDLFGGVADADRARGEEPDDGEDTADERSGSLADRLREAADELVEGSEDADADEDGEEVEEEGDEAEDERNDEAEERSDRRSTGRRGRYSSIPSKRPDMSGVGRGSTMPRRRRNE